MIDSHPAESLLVDYVAGTVERPSNIDEHLTFCTDCRAVVQRLREGGLGAPGGFDDLDDLPLEPEAPSVPAAAISALAEVDRRDLAPEQLWRAAPEGRDEMLLVWIRRVHSDGRPAVVPVTFDPEFADQYDLVVPAERSPLGVELVFHTTAEGTIDRRAMIDRVAEVGVPADIEAVRRARREGRRGEDLSVGAPIPSLHDERVEYRQHLTDRIVAMGTARVQPDLSTPDESHDQPAEADLQDDALDALFADALLAALVREVRNGLASSYPRCRFLPLSWPDVGGTPQPVATLLNIDVFVRLVVLDDDLELIRLLEATRAMFDGDLSISAVCFSSKFDPFTSSLIDRRAVVDAHETSVGELQPNADDVITGSVVEVLTKYFDRVVDPFRIVVSTAMDELNVDPTTLAMAAGDAAVGAVLSKAAGYKIPGKRPGYELVADRKQLVISIVEQALQPGGVDVRTALGEQQ
jgi:hypothetical protein